MPVKCFLGFFVFPEIVRFMKSGIDAITGCTVQVDTHMELVFMCHVNQLIYAFNSLFINAKYIPNRG